MTHDEYVRALDRISTGYMWCLALQASAIIAASLGFVTLFGGRHWGWYYVGLVTGLGLHLTALVWGRRLRREHAALRRAFYTDRTPPVTLVG